MDYYFGLEISPIAANRSWKTPQWHQGSKVDFPFWFRSAFHQADHVQLLLNQVDEHKWPRRRMRAPWTLTREESSRELLAWPSGIFELQHKIRAPACILQCVKVNVPTILLLAREGLQALITVSTICSRTTCHTSSPL